MRKKTTLLTEEGLIKLREELKKLKTVRRREVAAALQSAKEQGDLSENAEYIAAKERQEQIEARIAEIETMLKSAKIIPRGSGEKVEVGSVVTVEVDGRHMAYRIVGPDEADPAAGKISNESPLGASLLGHKVGEEVRVSSPSGEKKVKIIRVE
jgi:transcription elongation factor GreA